MLLPLPLFSFGIGSLFTLMMSMTADVCDLNELNTHKRLEGVFGAIYWWMVKFGFAIAGLFSSLILALVGFDQDAAAQSASALQNLKLAYILVPISGTLIAIISMSGYDLSEQRAHEIREQLELETGGSAQYSDTTIWRLVRNKFNYSLQIAVDCAGHADEEEKMSYLKVLHYRVLDPSMLVFIDETAKEKNASCQRRHWSPR